MIVLHAFLLVLDADFITHNVFLWPVDLVGYYADEWLSLSYDKSFCFGPWHGGHFIACGPCFFIKNTQFSFSDG